MSFTWNGKDMEAREGEMISTALFAQGISEFGHHSKDGHPQGIFCANGQCSQCMVMADGMPLKGCITPVTEGMDVRSMEGRPGLPEDDSRAKVGTTPKVEVDVLIAGAGPAGLNAALELGRAGVNVLVCDDKHEVGGKLSLQTHNFFGSVEECRAGTRGMDIGHQLEGELRGQPSVDLWLNSPVVGAFADGRIGVVRDGVYHQVTAQRFLVATGAREKALAFTGCDLPGVYGAGAFQTLVNRDLVRSSKRVFILGGGNVGLIAAYHALQAGIDVAGLVEALPQVGGYKVHLDKIRRLGVPVFTSHTVVEARGDDRLKSVVISRIDGNFKPVPGTARKFDADTLLVAVGLNPVSELARDARKMGIPTYEAGDAAVIAEASAAMFSGKITAREILMDMGKDIDIPPEWTEMMEILRSRPGPTHEFRPPETEDRMAYPVIRCTQEIPCNPCTEACPKESIVLERDDIMSVPRIDGDCIGCLRCAGVCPGLAIVIVANRKAAEGRSRVWIPWELPEGTINEGEDVTLTDWEGGEVGHGTVSTIRTADWMDRRAMVAVDVDLSIADKVAGIRIRTPEEGRPVSDFSCPDDDGVMICLCERVTKGEIRKLIREGVRDLNAIKAATRAGMGACGGKTCESLIMGIFREEGVPADRVKGYIKRPFTMEVPMSSFLGSDGK